MTSRRCCGGHRRDPALRGRNGGPGGGSSRGAAGGAISEDCGRTRWNSPQSQGRLGRVTFELALLQAELAAKTAVAATAVKRLSAMDATMMAAVAALTDVVDQFEEAAERDERHELRSCW